MCSIDPYKTLHEVTLAEKRRKNMRKFCLICALLCVIGCVPFAFAAEVDCDSVYCFSPEDFSSKGPVLGICVTQLPDPAIGTVMLGNTVIRSGDILSAEELNRLTFVPLKNEEDQLAQLTYLPIYENRVEKATTITLSVWGKIDKAPIARDSSLETYKNIPNDGTLPVSEPEGQQMTFAVVRKPKRGTVELRADGSFTYTPKKNKVGVDSFTYTATDENGNVSRTATVTVQVLKAKNSNAYTDTLQSDCRFEAEWLKNKGLFVGEQVGNAHCFYPEKTVSRGDFLAAVVKLLEIPMDRSDYAAVPSDVPQWLRPYVAAAIRSGLLNGWQAVESGSFDSDIPITQAEAAVILQNALALGTEEYMVQDVPAWAADSVCVMAENGIFLQWDAPLTREVMANTLYRVNILAVTAPGMYVIRMQ